MKQHFINVNYKEIKKNIYITADFRTCFTTMFS